MDPKIFREYDIRGVYGRDLTEDGAKRIGFAYGRLLKERIGVEDPKITVGRDGRRSAAPVFDALVSGLNAAGVAVVDIGLCPTPVLYFSLFNLPVSGGIMITASHNPPEYNGFKMCVGTQAIYGDDIRAIRELAGDAPPKGVSKEKIKTHDTIFDYSKYLKEKFEEFKELNVKSPLKVVLDSANGTAGPVAPRLFRSLGITVHELYSEVDGDFPNHPPDPTDEANLEELKRAVLDTRADFGIGFDGDADRVGIVDDRGRVVVGDQLMTIFSRDILETNPGAVVIGDVKCSKVMYDEIERAGGRAVMFKTGHSLIKKKMNDTGALLAGEMSGHIFFKHDYFGYDDGIYTGLRLCEIIAKEKAAGGVTLSRMVDALPKMHNTPEIRVPVDEEKKFEVVEAVKKRLKGKYKKYHVNDIDGVRVDFADGWGLIRASNTEPALVMRFEAETEERLGEIEAFFKGELERVGAGV
ncbi:MAG: phosphomannomutase/phosphoglucomutase [Deltaproteobacteria bacterium]|uniref:Phosphomannomutase/phosphoglucomutase n=1 Tax=Candidatus Zymogenus saltonus TaxID=2844893 RepID=A0A9D8PKM1_9DELT|nr:phosphomannomutase/phosphoglucomutase [Candidatus Zymogenus saltonus]